MSFVSSVLSLSPCGCDATRDWYVADGVIWREYAWECRSCGATWLGSEWFMRGAFAEEEVTP